MNTVHLPLVCILTDVFNTHCLTIFNYLIVFGFCLISILRQRAYDGCDRSTEDATPPWHLTLLLFFFFKEVCVFSAPVFYFIFWSFDFFWSYRYTLCMYKMKMTSFEFQWGFLKCACILELTNCLAVKIAVCN